MGLLGTERFPGMTESIFGRNRYGLELRGFRFGINGFP